MPPHRISRAAYRLLLRTYPREFRERFAADLEADFLQIVATRGWAHAWRRAAQDLFRAVPLTASDAMSERARADRVGGPIQSPGEPLMRALLFDLRHGLRALLRAPAFTTVTVLTLALGIGANSAIFSLVNAVLLRPLEYADPERLVLIHEAIPESGIPRFGVSPADYLDLADYQQAFSAIGAYRTRTLELSGSGEPEQVAAAELTASVFPVLGVEPARGRPFMPDEDRRESSVAVISHALWMRRFAGGDALGSRLVLDRRPYTIVGVMPPAFEFPKRGTTFNAEPADVWLPLVFNPFERQARGMMYNLSVIGRLRDGVPHGQAAIDTAALARRIHDNYPAQLRNAFTITLASTPLIDELSGQVRRPLLVFLGAVALVLLVACANVANLILSRSVTRQRDIGVRAALGAGRLRLFQVLLTEGVVLAVAGGVLGLVLGYWALRAIPAILMTSLPGVSDVAIDWRVLAFTGALSLGTATVLALVPFGAGVRRDLQDLLREGSGRAAGSRRQQKLQGVLVVGSVAFAFVLLVGAGLLVRSFRALLADDAGLDRAQVLTLEVRLPVAGYPEAPRMRSFYQGVTERLRATPGVRSATVATDLPLDSDGERRAVTPENPVTGGLPPSGLVVTWVHGDYFATFGIPIVSGRTFSADEHRENRDVVVVSRRLADTYWTGQDPIGKRLKWGVRDSPARWQTVIGVAGNVSDGPLGSDATQHIYVPFAEAPDAALASPLAGLLRRMAIAIHTDGDPRAFVGAARAAVAALDPALAVSRVQTIGQLQRDRSAPQRFSALVLSGFGAGALLLAAVGLYGVLAFAVAQRRREIGVRLALGAPRAEVIRLVVRQGMTLVGVGLLAGGIAAALATRLLKALLFQTNVHDPVTFATVPILLAAVALAASYLPARRAANVDPIVALRVD